MDRTFVGSYSCYKFFSGTGMAWNVSHFMPGCDFGGQDTSDRGSESLSQVVQVRAEFLGKPNHSRWVSLAQIRRLLHNSHDSAGSW